MAFQSRLHVMDRPVPPEWAARLREISPRTDTVAWLELVWEPVVERWFLYECLPLSAIRRDSLSEVLLAECKGPDPRTLSRDKRGFRSGTQWELFRRVGTVGHICWVIQGANGGHLFQHTEQQQKMLAASGLPPKAPLAGSLPFAPFDERVVARIQEQDRLMAFVGTFETWKRQRTEGWEAMYQAKEQEFREQYVRWLAASMGEAADLAAHAFRHGADAPRATSAQLAQWEEGPERFITTGVV